jgi:hypothetical protein
MKLLAYLLYIEVNFLLSSKNTHLDVILNIRKKKRKGENIYIKHI